MVSWACCAIMCALKITEINENYLNQVQNCKLLKPNWLIF